MVIMTDSSGNMAATPSFLTIRALAQELQDLLEWFDGDTEELREMSKLPYYKIYSLNWYDIV
jgi:hypothetical protein